MLCINLCRRADNVENEEIRSLAGKFFRENSFQIYLNASNKSITFTEYFRLVVVREIFTLWIVKLSLISTPQYGVEKSWRNISSNQLFSNSRNSFSKNVAFTKFLQENVRLKFHNFHFTVCVWKSDKFSPQCGW